MISPVQSHDHEGSPAVNGSPGVAWIHSKISCLVQWLLNNLTSTKKKYFILLISLLLYLQGNNLDM